MTSPSSKPQEVFRANFPVGTSLLVNFVPSKDRLGQPIDQGYWVDEILWVGFFEVRPLIHAAEEYGAAMVKVVFCSRKSR